MMRMMPTSPSLCIRFTAAGLPPLPSAHWRIVAWSVVVSAMAHLAGCLPAHARGAGAGAAPSFQAGPGTGRRVMVPHGRAVAPRSAIVVAPQQRVVVTPGHARNVIVAPRQRVVVSPQQHATSTHGHPVFVVPNQPVFAAPGTFLVVPQQPVFFVSQPYPSCVWCDELGCVRQTLDFCAMFAGP